MSEKNPIRTRADVDAFFDRLRERAEANKRSLTVTLTVPAIWGRERADKFAVYLNEHHGAFVGFVLLVDGASKWQLFDVRGLEATLMEYAQRPVDAFVAELLK